ncbi:hypothetical protein PVAND_009739 [Polypedilum vanderplanki]|uniref:Uncharacterized protein n=1 Tax=Polypedilum vanderplanki TaxID=319348 RepID=A0A9J6CF12_POLVA|nr:hypothetical protein PVAND_009739 [Polypedilum vanderplanki]
MEKQNIDEIADKINKFGFDKPSTSANVELDKESDIEDKPVLEENRSANESTLDLNTTYDNEEQEYSGSEDLMLSSMLEQKSEIKYVVHDKIIRVCTRHK